MLRNLCSEEVVRGSVEEPWTYLPHQESSFLHHYRRTLDHKTNEGKSPQSSCSHPRQPQAVCISTLRWSARRLLYVKWRHALGWLGIPYPQMQSRAHQHYRIKTTNKVKPQLSPLSTGGGQGGLGWLKTVLSSLSLYFSSFSPALFCLALRTNRIRPLVIYGTPLSQTGKSN